MNTKIWEAARLLATAEGDARSRVVAACIMLDKLSEQDLEALPKHISLALENLLKEAGSADPVRNSATKEIAINKYAVTSYGKHNKTYTKYASTIWGINEEINNFR